MIVLLDTGVLSLIISPLSSDQSDRCIDWMYGLLAKGVQICTSDVCDYELRRGLTLARMQSKDSGGIEKLNNLREVIDFLPITSEILNEASMIWAKAKFDSQLNAPSTDINFDIIICSQWKILNCEFPGRRVVIATYNLRDFLRFSDDVDLFENISF